MLLIAQVLVCGDKDLELFRSKSQQLPVLHAGPTHELDGAHEMAFQFETEPTRHRFVEQDAPHAASNAWRLSSSRATA
ncbi:MAG: hypothetical protein WC091_17270 [Sulfuricellaceae bacterium]